MRTIVTHFWGNTGSNGLSRNPFSTTCLESIVKQNIVSTPWICQQQEKQVTQHISNNSISSLDTDIPTCHALPLFLRDDLLELHPGNNKFANTGSSSGWIMTPYGSCLTNIQNQSASPTHQQNLHSDNRIQYNNFFIAHTNKAITIIILIPLLEL